jgi:hypothetical protein
MAEQSRTVPHQKAHQTKAHHILMVVLYSQQVAQVAQFSPQVEQCVLQVELQSQVELYQLMVVVDADLAQRGQTHQVPQKLQEQQLGPMLELLWALRSFLVQLKCRRT